MSIVLNLKNTLKFLLKKYGYEIKKIPKSHVDAFSDQQALMSNTKVEIIFDVGSHVGQTACKYINLFPDAKIHCFEPSEGSFKILDQTYGEYDYIMTHKIAIADVSNREKFYYINNDKFSAANSLLKPAIEHNNYLEFSMDCPQIVETNTIKIDDFCYQHKIDKIHILKMDIQGGELKALKGATHLLGQQSIDLLYTEVSFVKLYEGQAFFYELCEFLKEYGYVLYGLYSLQYGKNGVLAWGDAIFISSNLEKELDDKEFSLF